MTWSLSFIPTFHYENFQSYEKIEHSDHAYTLRLDATMHDGFAVFPPPNFFLLSHLQNGCGQHDLLS